MSKFKSSKSSLRTQDFPFTNPNGYQPSFQPTNMAESQKKSLNVPESLSILCYNWHSLNLLVTKIVHNFPATCSNFKLMFTVIEFPAFTAVSSNRALTGNFDSIGNWHLRLFRAKVIFESSYGMMHCSESGLNRKVMHIYVSLIISINFT